MPQPPEPAPAHARWWPVLLALAGFLYLPTMPTALVSVVPITETWMLLGGAVAICAALAWWNGGGLWLVALAVVLFVLVLGTPLHGVGVRYTLMTRGWVLVLAAAFGVASLLTPSQGFFSRALIAVGLAITVAFGVVIATPDGITSVHDVVQARLTQRTDSTILSFDRTMNDPAWRRMADEVPTLDSAMAHNKRDLAELPAKAAPLAPSLLALESLAALALAWAVFDRIPVAPVGPRLGELREFRFSDQLVWGLAVGATIVILPVFADGKMAGWNLLAFFGALYLLRGVGVLSWMARSKWVATLLIVLTFFGFPVVGAVALGVGVVDTWMDWRNRGQHSAA